MNFITPEYQKILDQLPPKEKADVKKVLDSVSKDAGMCAFASKCRTTASTLFCSLREDWRLWLKSFFIVLLAFFSIVQTYESIAYKTSLPTINAWLAKHYAEEFAGQGFFHYLLGICTMTISYTFSYYIITWAIAWIIKMMAKIAKSAEMNWSHTRSELFAYLEEREHNAEAVNPAIWYAPREQAAMKDYIANNPNYHAAKGRSWANQI